MAATSTMSCFRRHYLHRQRVGPELRPRSICKQACLPPKVSCSARQPHCRSNQKAETSAIDKHISLLMNWLGIPTNSSVSLGLVLVPLANVKFTPLSALLFTALVTWALTAGLLSLIQTLTDEGAAPMHVIKLQFAISSESVGLRKELSEVERYFHAHNSKDLYFMVEDSLMEVRKRWEQCRLGGVEVKSSSSYREAQMIFEDAAASERARVRGAGTELLSLLSGGELLRNGGPMTGKGRGAKGGLFGMGVPARVLGMGGAVTRRLGRVFAGRGANQSDGSDGGVVVVTLLLLTTRPLNLVGELGTPGRVGAALQELGCMTSGQVLDAQIYWSPDGEGEFLSEQRALSEFPELGPL